MRGRSAGVASKERGGEKENERMHRLRNDPNHSTKRRSDSHGRNKDTSRDLASVRDDDETCSNDGSEKEGVDVGPLSEGSERRIEASKGVSSRTGIEKGRRLWTHWQRLS